MLNDPTAPEVQDGTASEEATPSAPEQRNAGPVRGLRKKFETEGSFVVPQVICPLTREEWMELDKLTDALPYEYRPAVTSSYDIAEVLNRDGLRPDLKGKRTNAKIRDLVTSPRAMRIFKVLSGNPNIKPVRIHGLILNVGDTTGEHAHYGVDVSVVFHFPNECTGGIYRDWIVANEPREHSPPPFSVFVSKGHIQHEVTPVIKGTRKSLVVFFSEKFA